MLPTLLQPKDEVSILGAFQQAVNEADALLPQEQRSKGGRMRLFHFHTPEKGHGGLSEAWISPWVGGTANKGGEWKYYLYTCEKGMRLAQMYKLNRHVSSGQSANSANEMWNGASLVQCVVPNLQFIGDALLIVSVSGWPQEADAAIGLRTLQLMERWRPNVVDIEQVVRVTSNGFAKGLLKFG